MSNAFQTLCRRALCLIVLLMGVIAVEPGRAEAQVIRGACCFANGTCQRFQRTVCTGRGGTWTGTNTTCAPNPCPQPRGGCCFTDGGCGLLTQVGCQSRHGVYQGNATTCGVRTCPRPSAPAGSGSGGGGGGGGGGGNSPPVPQIGACCLRDLSCIETSVADCDDRNGTFEGIGLPCFRVYCPAATPPSACCFLDGSCTTTTPIDCLGRAGYSQVGSVCSPTACVQMGACCAADNSSCAIVSQSDCTAQGGRYRGNFSSCTNGGCVANSGACCMLDSSCVMATPAECTSYTGRFRGINTTCSQQYCVDNTTAFACCLGDATCVMTVLRDCFARRGVWGNGSTCQPTLCQVMGACCLANSLCQSTGQQDCLNTGGRFGAGASCNIQFCPRACPCNWNGDRWVNEGDLFRFVSDWMQGRADFDGDGDTDESDARQFIDCLLHHPAGC